MGRTSNESKQNWNKTHYTQVKVSIPPQIAAAFKEKCLQNNVSMASEISRFMSEQTKVTGNKTPKTEPYGTRQLRRKALYSLMTQLEGILDAEQAYWQNIPANMQNGERYEAAEQAVSAMEEALDMLHQAY